MPQEKIRILLERDSVCAADDCDAPHTLILAYDKPPTIHNVITHIIQTNYLASIYNGGVTWVAIGKCPLAILIQQRETHCSLIESQRPIQEPFQYVDELENEPFSFHIFNYLIDENALYSEYIDEKIYIEYHRSGSPEKIYEMLRKENQSRKM